MSEIKAPPKRTPRQLVLCFDGTGNEFGKENTNVVKLFAMLTKNSSSMQKVYYQTGIGTYDPDGWLSSADKIIDSAVAKTMQHHVTGGYKFLMQTYESGDEISLFGFSRGAATVRALAAMLYHVGLLPQDNDEHVSFAWNIFAQAHQEKDKTDWTRYQSLNFKRTFSREVKVHFLGLWDTVVGVAPVKMTHYNPIVYHVRHAIALHETRDRFQVELWGASPTSDSEEAFRETEASPDNILVAPAARVGANTAGQAHIEKCGEAGLQSTDPHAHSENIVADVQEVWFAGFHSDVGGGNTNYWDKNALSYISLRWMVREALKHTNIIFETSVLEVFNIVLPSAMENSGARLTKQEYYKIEKEDAESNLHSPYENGLMGVFYSVAEHLPKYRSDGRGYSPHHAKPRELGSPTSERPNRIHSSVLTMLARRAQDDAAALESLRLWGTEHVKIVDQWALDPESKAGKLLLKNYGPEVSDGCKACDHVKELRAAS